MKESTPEIALGFIEYMEGTYVGKYCFTTELRKVGPLVSFSSFDHVDALPPFNVIKYDSTSFQSHVDIVPVPDRYLSPVFIMFRRCIHFMLLRFQRHVDTVETLSLFYATMYYFLSGDETI